MDQFKMDEVLLWSFLTLKCEQETVDYVLGEMRRSMAEDMPEAEAVRAYLEEPDKPTELSTYQQMIAMDKLLECAEIHFRTVCDLIRYRQLRDAGVVNTVDEFLRLFHPDDSEKEETG